jgi:hypothetical protein
LLGHEVYQELAYSSPAPELSPAIQMFSMFLFDCFSAQNDFAFFLSSLLDEGKQSDRALSTNPRVFFCAADRYPVLTDCVGNCRIVPQLARTV